jgi:tetratricopeptide (TPR) repeat protein
MKSLFEKFFGRKRGAPKTQNPDERKYRNVQPRVEPKLYKAGDIIGRKYEINRVLGQGGFGVVYLAFNRVTKSACALKTISDEWLTDGAGLEAFKKEALIWVNLDRHSFVLAAKWVEEFYCRLFVEMDYIAPDARERVTLADHLDYAGGPLETAQSLKWAVQFCVGMEHIQRRGIAYHGDIKPTNILITQDGTLKISDFGLAQAAEAAWVSSARKGGSVWRRNGETISFSLVERDGKLRCGTPGYMPPEVYRGEQADVRSDIYSFGLVLWQMAAGSRVPPFWVPYRGDLEDYLRGIYKRQMTRRAPRVEGFLGPAIERCLRPRPAERFGSFAELREELEPIMERTTGHKPEFPQVGDKTTAFWIAKGSSLSNLGRTEEAIKCLDRALMIDPRNLIAWSNKGTMLIRLGQFAGAITSFDKVLAIEPRDAIAWNEKGRALAELRRFEEAISCHDQALAIGSQDALAWNNKGRALAALGRLEDGLDCYDRALATEPQDAEAWYNKGATLAKLKRHEEAIGCYDRALTIYPENAFAWNNKGAALTELKRHEEAIECYNRALAVDPRDTFAWTGKGATLARLTRHEKAIRCYDRALTIDPRHMQAWLNKAYSEDALGRKREAAFSYRKFIELGSREASDRIARVRQRLTELESQFGAR